MSWSPINTNTIDIKKSKDKEYEGTYTGHKEITTKIGPQVIWEFSGDEGNFGIYGFTNLNRAMESLKVGTAVKIVYRGTINVKTKYGMKDVHQADVMKWDGNVVEEAKDVFGIKDDIQFP